MARRKRKMVDVLDPERFAQAKAAIVRFGEQEGQTEKITDAKALRAMVSTAATMYNCPGERLMLVDWTAAQEHMVRTSERLADEIIEAHCRGMSDFLGMQITVKREGKRYSFECESDKGVKNLFYDKSENGSQGGEPN